MTPIYHITHVANLPRILEQGGLLCDAEVQRRNLCRQSIAYDAIKQRRKMRRVQTLTGNDVAAGGMVADYVPFYFANRSPMLYAIHSKSVPSFSGGEREVIYLVSSVERATTLGQSWCFTNGHAVEAVTDFADQLPILAQVDWKLIRDWSWRDTIADPDRKRRKQAEFLVHQTFPWSAIERLAAMDESTAQQVRQMLAGHNSTLQVTVEPDWYHTTTINRR